MPRDDGDDAYEELCKEEAKKMTSKQTKKARKPTAKTPRLADPLPRKKKPDAERCGLCGAMCANPLEVSRHHRDDCSRYPRYPEVQHTTPLYNPKTGQPWEHTHNVAGAYFCRACIVEANAPRVGGVSWADFVEELITKLGYGSNDRVYRRNHPMTGEVHLYILIGPAWEEDAKQKWAANWTVDGYVARRPNLMAPSTPSDYIRDNPQLRGRAAQRLVNYYIPDSGDGVGAEHSPSPRWGVAVTKRGVVFNIDHQSFTLSDDFDPEDGMTKEAYYKWYAKQLTIAFKRLMDEL